MRFLAWINLHDPEPGPDPPWPRHLSRVRRGSSDHDGAVAPVVRVNNLLDVQDTFGAAVGERLVQGISERGREQTPDDVPLAHNESDLLVVV